MDEMEQFLKRMRKEFGDVAVFSLDDVPEVEVDVIPTGSLALDVALGVGGIPRGRLTELYGSEGSGKTTLCFHVVCEAQKLGLNTLFVDMENSINLEYAQKIGVKVDNEEGGKVYWNQPSTQEEALKVIEEAIRSKAFGLIILDSVGALAPKKEQEDDLGSANVALTPRALTQFFRRNMYAMRDNNVAVLFTNQVRDNITSFFGGIVTPGGNALKHSRSVALYIRRKADVKTSGEVVGHTAEVVVKKNKLAAPFKSAEFDIIYGKGIDPYRDLIEVAKNLGVLIQKGPYYTYNGENIGQGKENAALELSTNPELVEEIRRECL